MQSVVLTTQDGNYRLGVLAFGDCTMPKLTDSLPKYRKHKATGQAVVTLDGRDFYLGPHRTKASKLEYDRYIGEWLANGRSLKDYNSSGLTVAELILDYFRFVKSYYRKNGTYTSEVAATKFSLKPVRQLYSKQLARDFGPLALVAVRSRMIDQGWNRNVVNRAVGRVRRMFKWAVSKELLPPTVYQALLSVDGLRKGRCEVREGSPVLPVDDNVVQSTLEHLPQTVADMVQLQRHTGMRPGEVCSIRPCEVDRSDDVWLYRPASHKTEHHERDRIILVGPKGQQVLLRYLARDPKMECFRPCDSEEKRRAEAHANRKTPHNQGNCPGPRKRKAKRPPGDCYCVDSYRRAIHRACDKAFPHPKLGYKMRSSFTDAEKQELREWQKKHHWSPNQLRHTAASQIRSEYGLEEAQVILGHSNANVTQVYAERDLAKGIEVAKKIG